jgi:hypothetical protein
MYIDPSCSMPVQTSTNMTFQLTFTLLWKACVCDPVFVLIFRAHFYLVFQFCYTVGVERGGSRARPGIRIGQEPE